MPVQLAAAENPLASDSHQTSAGAIYLDNLATSAVDPRVLEAMLPFFSECFGNAASKTHSYGLVAAEALETARAQVARLVGAPSPQEVIFTSGATEANNLALWHAFRDPPSGEGLVLSTIEHPSVLRTADLLAQRGAVVKWVEPASDGRVRAEDMVAAMDALGERLRFQSCFEFTVS